MQNGTLKHDGNDIKDMQGRTSVQSQNDLERNAEIVFADMVQEKNQNQKQIYRIAFVVYLFWMLGINLLLDYQLQDMGDRLAGVVLLLGMILWIWLFSERYLDGYFTLSGKNGEQAQDIASVIRQFPFSLSEYGRYVRGRMVFWQCTIFASTVALSGVGMLIFIRNELYPVFLWETQIRGEEIANRLVLILLVSLCIAMIPAVMLRVRLRAADKRRMQDNSRTDSSDLADAGKMRQQRKWMLIVLEICLVVFIILIYGILSDQLHPVERDGILFIQIPNLGWASVVALIDGGRDISRYLQNKEDYVYAGSRTRVMRNVIIKVLIGVALFILPQYYYDTYYEDRMVIHRFGITREYTWQDVESYEISRSVWGEDIQLCMRMKDGSKRKAVKSNSNRSEKYYDAYDNEVHYAAKMVEKLDAAGARGEIKYPDKIEDKMRKEPDEYWKAWKMIRRIIQQ